MMNIINISNGMAKVAVENFSVTSTYSDKIDLTKASEKIENLIQKEMNRKSLKECFAFGEGFKKEVVDVLKGRC